MANELENQVDDPEIEGGDEDKPKSKKLVVILTIVLLSLAAAAAVVVFVVYPMYQDWALAKASEPEEKVEKEKEKPEIGLIHMISDLTVNPKDSGGRRYAVFELALEVADQPASDLLNKYHPIIVDHIISYFRTRTIIELADESLLPVLKEDLKIIINDTVHDDVVRELYFTRFVLE